MSDLREFGNASLFTDAAAVTPADGADLAKAAQALYVGGAGALVVDTKLGTTVTFAAVPAGTTLLLRVKRVRSTGTTATSIVALYK
jgi:hypothetical protein